MVARLQVVLVCLVVNTDGFQDLSFQALNVQCYHVGIINNNVEKSGGGGEDHVGKRYSKVHKHL